MCIITDDDKTQFTQASKNNLGFYETPTFTTSPQTRPNSFKRQEAERLLKATRLLKYYLVAINTVALVY